MNLRLLRLLRAPLFAVVVAGACLWSTAADAARAVIVIRHAEKEKDPPDDPELSIPGLDRAIALTRFLRHNKIDAIFVTQYKRTQQTAEVLAKQRGLTPTIVKAGDNKALVEKINALPKDAVVVVVGHSNTLPDIIQALGAHDKVSLRDDEYNRVFVVTPAGADTGLLEFAY